MIAGSGRITLAILGIPYGKSLDSEELNFILAVDFDVYAQRTRNWTRKIIIEHTLGSDDSVKNMYFVIVAKDIFSKVDAFSMAAEAFESGRNELKVESVIGDAQFEKAYGETKTFIGYKRLVKGVNFVFGVLVDTCVLNR